MRLSALFNSISQCYDFDLGLRTTAIVGIFSTSLGCGIRLIPASHAIKTMYSIINFVQWYLDLRTSQLTNISTCEQIFRKIFDSTYEQIFDLRKKFEQKFGRKFKIKVRFLFTFCLKNLF